MSKIIFRFLVTTALLVGVWLLLSDKTDWFHLGIGIVAAAFIAARCASLQPPALFPVFRFLAYIPWLLKQVIQSNLHVARLVLPGGPKIAPRFIRKAISGIDDERAQTLLGCSITLTPGTLTVRIDGDSMLIHALDEDAADEIERGVMAGRVNNVFKGSA